MDNLALSAFEQQVDTVFTLMGETDSPIDLVLVSGTKLPASNPLGSPESGRPFSLLFRGPVESPIGQATHALSHPVMGRLEIFLVPMQPDADGPLYEAVFA